MRVTLLFTILISFCLILTNSNSSIAGPNSFYEIVKSYNEITTLHREITSNWISDMAEEDSPNTPKINAQIQLLGKLTAKTFQFIDDATRLQKQSQSHLSVFALSDRISDIRKILADLVKLKVATEKELAVLTSRDARQVASMHFSIDNLLNSIDFELIKKISETQRLKLLEQKTQYENFKYGITKERATPRSSSILDINYFFIGYEEESKTYLGPGLENRNNNFDYRVSKYLEDSCEVILHDDERKI